MRIEKRKQVLIRCIFLLSLFLASCLGEYTYKNEGDMILYYLAVFFRCTILAGIGGYIVFYLKKISNQISSVAENVNSISVDHKIDKYANHGIDKIEKVIRNLWDKLINEQNIGIFNEFINNELDRNKFIEECNKLFKRFDKREFTVLNFKIDKFEYVAEIYDSEYANVILNYIEDVLDEFVNKDEIYSRWHNYNFVILLKERNDSEIIKRINNLSNTLIQINNNQKKFNMRYSFGIYKIEEDANNIDQMIDKARIALKIANVQRNNGQSYVFYNSSLKDKIIEEQKMENLMYEALENKEFKVYLQGKNDLNSLDISGAEALVRWNSKELGFISPMDFVTLFEKNGFIVEVDFYIFEEVCRNIRKWLDDGIEVNITSINQSKRHLDNDDYVSRLKSIIDKYNVPAELIELEITETAVTDNVDRLVNVIDELHKLGFKISIDDFGSGYSSLNMLKQINADVLKIDKEFLNEAYESKKSKTIIKHVIKMAKELEIKTITEGVERVEQAEFLRNIGCDMAQGFLYSKPIPISEFADKYYYKKVSMN